MGAVLLFGGCGAADEAVEREEKRTLEDCLEISSSLRVEPATLERDAAELITITWSVSDFVRDSTALMSVGEAPEPEVEVEVLLEQTSSGEVASFVNPFGFGTSPGEVTILASGQGGRGAVPSSSIALVIPFEQLDPNDSETLKQLALYLLGIGTVVIRTAQDQRVA